RRMMIDADSAIIENEIEQVRHQLKIGRHIWVVTPQVDIVERNVDDAFDLPVGRLETARRLCPFQHAKIQHNTYNGRRWKGHYFPQPAHKYLRLSLSSAEQVRPAKVIKRVRHCGRMTLY